MIYLQVKTGSSPQSATFIFGNEDHTLGNALRYILMERPETDFCGYSVPHPYEPKMNVRLQTVNNSVATTVLHRGLIDLELTADALDVAFDNALQRFDLKKST
mmetsp:Transcript_12869/g.17654  ORF Transcript_12869/g.17654 Transcript_12869/m.17654 type:complete len:103 (+) Transcript_12869:329-637(+)